MLSISISHASFSLRRVGFLDAETFLRMNGRGAISALVAVKESIILALAAALALQIGQSHSSPQSAQWPPSGRMSVISCCATKESKILHFAAIFAVKSAES